LFCSLTFAEADPGAATVLVDEFKASPFRAILRALIAIREAYSLGFFLRRDAALDRQPSSD
jgi:hypothetical protein